jgi:creatinine amidohydrolase/Fe(II)-dependent formamide hydrolase-like protein
MPRPIAAVDSVFLEELTWLEVRDALRAGKTTVVIATGGVEQNGPYLVTGKHNYVLRATTEAIARKLGNALVAPIVAFVPEGSIDPASGHMRYPGTISVRPQTFERLLTDIAESLRVHGFRHIILIGDSGGNQRGMADVAKSLGVKWRQRGIRIYYVPEYYREWTNPQGPQRLLEAQGIHQIPEGLHDDFIVSAVLMSVDPQLVRMHQRVEAGKFSINGVSLAPPARSIALGRQLVDHVADVTVTAIRKAIALGK